MEKELDIQIVLKSLRTTIGEMAQKIAILEATIETLQPPTT